MTDEANNKPDEKYVLVTTINNDEFIGELCVNADQYVYLQKTRRVDRSTHDISLKPISECSSSDSVCISRINIIMVSGADQILPDLLSLYKSI